MSAKQMGYKQLVSKGLGLVLLLLVMVSGYLLFAPAARADSPVLWQPATFPAGTAPDVLAIDPSNPNQMWAGFGMGYFYRSDNGGASWSLPGSGLPRGCGYGQPAFHPDGQHVALPGNCNGEETGLYLSNDNGVTWCQGFRGSSVQSVGITPADPSKIYAIVSLGEAQYSIRRSDDGGGNWTTIDTGLPTSGFGFVSLSLHPSDPAIAYFIYYGPRPDSYAGPLLWKTVNSGAAWQVVSTSGIPNSQDFGYPCVKSISVNPVTLTILLAVANSPATNCSSAWGGQSEDNSVYRSTDGGNTWSGPTISGFISSQVSLDPTNWQTMYVTKNDGVYQSLDGGQNWQRVGMPPHAANWMYVDRKTPRTLYGFDMYSQEYISYDSGQTWITGTAPYQIGPTSAYPGGGLAAGMDTLYESPDGMNWYRQDRSLPNAQLTALAVDPTNPLVLHAGVYAWAGGPLAWKSVDGGSTWMQAGAGLPASTLTDTAGVYGFAINPSQPQVVYAEVRHAAVLGLLYKSSDGGNSWDLVGAGLPNSIYALAHDPDSVFVGTNVGLFKSSNGGSSWTSLGPLSGSTGVYTDVMSLAFTNGTLIAGVSFEDQQYDILASALVRSADGGQTWQAGVLPSSMPSQILFDRLATVPGAVYASWRTPSSYGGSRGMLRSVDGGATWTPFAFPDCAYLAGSGSDGGLYLSLAGVGLIRTGDAGATWSFRGTGMANAKTQDSLFFAGAGDEVVAAGAASMLQSLDRGQTWQFRVFEQSSVQNPFAPCLAPSKVLIHPANPNLIFVAGRGGLAGVPGFGLFRSSDGGATWQHVINAASIVDIQVSPQNPNQMWVAAEYGGIWSSSDGGVTWQVISREYTPVESLAVNPKNPDLMLGATTSGCIRSVDGGYT